MIISLLPPTRGRPYNMYRMWVSALDTAAQPDKLEIVFYIDDDDKDSIEQFNFMWSEWHNAVKAVIGPRITMSEMHNRAYALSRGDVVAFIGDDVMFRSQGWDDLIRAEFEKVPDHILLVYGEDGINGAKLGVHGFLHRKWVEILGYVTPPIYTAFFADTHINEVAHNLGRRVFLPNVYIEHLHPSVGKGPQDQTTLEMYERNRRDNNDGIWQQTLDKRIADTQKLAKHINLELTQYERIL